MSVLVECISVIVRREALDRLYPGGAAAYERDCPNDSFCADDQLTRVGFMTPVDTQAFIDRLVARGFVFVDENGFRDIAVVDQMTGPTAPCDWLSFGKHVAGFTMAWAPGTSPSPMNAPAGWNAGRTDRIKFNPTEQANEYMVPLGRRGNLDVYLDTRTGREVYVGRTSSS